MKNNKNFLHIIFTIIMLFPRLYSLEYIVKKGDTFWSLSQRFNIDTSIIKKLNEIDSLKEGEKIFIPEEIITYKVKEGDTLIGISRKFFIPLKYIIILNNLPYDKILPGQELKIPLHTKHQESLNNNSVINPLYHKVGSNETLFSIARNYNVTIEKIKEWNNKTNDVIFQGEILKIYSRDKTYEEALTEVLTLPIEKGLIKKKIKNRRGISLILNEKSNVRSTIEGFVNFEGKINGLGRVVIIKNSKNKIIYGYLSDVFVKKGDKVDPQTIIGAVDYHDFLKCIALYVEVREGLKVKNVEDFFPLLKDATLYVKK